MMTKSAIQTRRVLVITDGDVSARDLWGSLTQGAELHEVRSVSEAIEALRRESFDLIISERGDLLSSSAATGTMPEAMVLEALGQGACIVDALGKVTWSNPALRAYSTELVQGICDNCRRILAETPDAGTTPRSRHFSVSTSDELYFEVAATPIQSGGQRPAQIVAVAWDTTRSRRLQRKIDAIDMAGRDLVELDVEDVNELGVEERLQLLEDKIFKYMHDLLSFDNFAIMLLDRKSNRLDIVLQHGMADHVNRLDIMASAEGNGISGYVAATGRSYICPDTTKDPRYIKGLERARSSLTVPLRLHDQVVGVFDIESERPAAFNEDDRQFAEILGRYIAVALNVLDLLVSERCTVAGRLVKDVAGEIAAPLNDILANAAALIEEYIGHDDLRRRLGAICDHVSGIRRTLQEVGQPRGGVLGRTSTEKPSDPTLNGKRVLVADDEEIIRETIGSVLTNYGCEVETASDGIEAVALIEARPYDLVIADIKMPNKNGYEVFATARDRDPNRPVILITGFGYDPNHSIVRARREGLAAVLFKPFKVDQLLEEVRCALRGRPAAGS